MGKTTEHSAERGHRSRPKKPALVTFEVLGLESDRELVRAVARCLAEDAPQAAQLRAIATRLATGHGPKGRILTTLRRSPLIGADLDLTTCRDDERDVDF